MINEESLKNILLHENYLSEEDVRDAEKESEKLNIPLFDYLYENKLITKTLVGQALAESYNLPFADLSTFDPPKEIVQKVEHDIATKYRTILFKVENESYHIATDSPKDELKSILSTHLKTENITIYYTLTEYINQNLNDYRKPLETRFQTLLHNKLTAAPEIVKEIFSDAVILKASDVHFEPDENDVLIRFRIDGVLQEAGNIPKTIYENILNYIKIQSQLKIDEHRAAQDGALRLKDPDKQINYDLRVSIVPTLNGEKIAMRVLAEYISNLSLEDIGLSENDTSNIEEVLKKTYGMILVVGPTGAGKTTTLYSILKRVKSPEINITTIEDPVEYKIKNINQIQVNKDTGLTFAQGLRTIVRQDPDIILVGEIRDKETAEISINAALTGHLLFSTFHANTAATAIPRLLEMDVEPFLLASTLQAVVGQRLIRKICVKCRYSMAVETKVLLNDYPYLEKYINKESKSINMFQSKGCESCNFTGFKGRTGIYEFLRITPDLQALILDHPSATEVQQVAKLHGSKTLFEDGIEKVKKGVTTLEELLRVAEPPNHEKEKPRPKSKKTKKSK